jgi:GT2 family glycosyltransferase
LENKILPQLSFVVPLFNHLEHSKVTLASLQASIPSGLVYEIVLVDDASTDGTRGWLAGLDDPQLRVVLNASNLGFAGTTNAGIAKAAGAILVLVNNDLIFAPGWLEPMLAVLQDPLTNAGLVGNVQKRVSDNGIDHVGVYVDATGKLVHQQALPKTGLTHARVFAVTGACCLIRRNVFDAAGGFDESFVNGGEDIDLCMKVRRLGLDIYMAFGSVVRHHVSLSRDRSSLQNERNSRLVQAKWRILIKREMMQVWVKDLNDKHSDTMPKAFADLVPSFLSTPHAAAGVLSENALTREEARWTRLLDQRDPNEGLLERCRLTGVQFDRVREVFVLTNHRVFIWIDYPQGLDGFYIVGRQTAPAGVEAKVTLTINGVQKRVFSLGSQRNFNLGIDCPVVLPSITNCIEVAFSLSPANPVISSPLDWDPCRFIELKHFVVDGKCLDHL